MGSVECKVQGDRCLLQLVGILLVLHREERDDLEIKVQGLKSLLILNLMPLPLIFGCDCRQVTQCLCLSFLTSKINRNIFMRVVQGSFHANTGFDNQ